MMTCQISCEFMSINGFFYSSCHFQTGLVKLNESAVSNVPRVSFRMSKPVTFSAIVSTLTYKPWTLMASATLVVPAHRNGLIYINHHPLGIPEQQRGAYEKQKLC